MDSPPPSDVNLWPLAVWFEGGAALLALVLGWLLSAPPLHYVEWSGAALAWGCLASLPLLAVMLGVTHFPRGPLARLDQLVREVIVPLVRSCSTLEFLLISVLAGVGEELLFRGVMQAQLARWWSPAAGLALASIAFGLAHAISTAYAVLAGLFGVYLGAVWLWSGNLLVAITAHAVYDFLTLVYLVRRDAPKTGRRIRRRSSVRLACGP